LTPLEPPLTLVRIEEAALIGVQFRDEQARVPVPFDGLAVELVGKRHCVRTEKRGTPVFSAVVFEPGAQRGKKGVRHVTALVLDFDHQSAEQAQTLLDKVVACGWAWLAYSSFSHLARGPDDHCFRLLLWVSRPILPAEYPRVWEAVDRALGGRADPNAKDISRIWYVASCPPEREAVAWMRSGDGRPIDVDRALEAAPRPAPSSAPDNGPHSSTTLAEGERNAGLVKLGGVLRRGGAGRDELTSALAAANAARCRPPLDGEEVASIVDSLLRYDPASPLLALNLTDAGNAERFKAHQGHRFAYCHAWGAWLVYGKGRWSMDKSGEATRAAIETLRAVATEALKVPSDEVQRSYRKHAVASEASARLGAMVKIGQDLLPVGVDVLDCDPFLLNVQNGTLDLRAGVLRPHEPLDWLTHQCPVAYDEGATCPQWESFLLRVMGGNAGLVSFLQRAVGYSLTGATGEHVLFMLYGVGANGKSTFLETLRGLTGDYSASAEFTTFTKRENEGARNDIARLVGRRLVSAVEGEAGKALAESVVKQLTGGDTITARFLYQEYFEFKPQFKLWLATNHKPTIAGGDHGIWRRIRLVPFTVTIPEAERDPRLGERLAAELPGILTWAVQGCLAWRKQGLALPDEVRAATDSYREEMDVFSGFLDALCIAKAGARITAKELYEAYCQWCEANGERPCSQKALSKALQDHGFSAAKGSKGVRCWEGVRLRRDDDGAVQAGGGWRMGGANSGSAVDSAAAPLAAGAQEVGSLLQPDSPKHPPPSATRHPGDEPPDYEERGL